MDEMLPEISQLLDGLSNIRERLVHVSFRRCWQFRPPIGGEQLQGCHVEVTVVEECLETGEVADHEPAILTNRIAAHWGTIRRYPLVEKPQSFLRCRGLVNTAGSHAIDQS